MLPVGLLLLGFLVAGDSDGSLRVKTDVAEVQVFLDGQEVGQTPVTVTPVPAGRHRVTLMKAGYEDHVEEVEVQPGATARMFVVMKRSNVPLPPVPASYRALHQHRIGGCLGNLTVTAEAVDYRADDGKDVFHIPIREIRSLSRSTGSTPFSWSPLTPADSDLTGCRLETPGRSYGFFAVEGEPKSADEVRLEDTAKKTKELFEIVYQLWQDSLTARKRPAVQ
jgi:hypothetical protein